MDILAAQAAAEMLRRRTMRRDLGAWCEHVLAPLGQSPAAHHRLLIRELQAVADGRCDRLMVCMPPGSAKSTYTSALFPPFFLSRHPRSSIIAASHTASFARRWGRRVRNTIAEHGRALGYGLAADEQAADRWSTDAGGEYGSYGIGGSVTGRRADLAIIDDPVAGQEAADSEQQRETAWEWYRQDLYTRLKPGGRIVLVMTRWHEDDLGGRILLDMQRGGDQWQVLILPALAGPADPLGRGPGEALWPAWEDTAALARKRAAVGERAWQALYQQDPRPLEGGLFRATQISILDAAPAGRNVVRAWDLASTAQHGASDPDWTVGVKMLMADGRYTVLDIVRLRGGPEEVQRAVLNTAALDGSAVRIRLPQDPGQAGKAQIADFAKRLAGYAVSSQRPTGDKGTRAAPFASQVNAGNVSMLRRPWSAPFVEELRGFPTARHDDQVDAASDAFAELTALPQPARMANIPFMLR